MIKAWFDIWLSLKFLFNYFEIKKPKMDEEIYVSCHAPSLSLLLYETARSVHDQKGLLIGQICNEVISRKTDENEVNRERKTAIYLEHCIPFDDQDVIGNAGLINKSKLQKFINFLNNKIVGWYSFRRNSHLVPNSLAEMLIHRSLLELLPNAKSQYFIACFMSSNVAANMSTHIFNHLFTTFDLLRGRFEPLRLKIYTLSDKSVNSNGYLMKNPFPTSSSFDKIISYAQKEESPVKSVLAVHERVSEILKLIDKKLQKLESFKSELEEEVLSLRLRMSEVNSQEIVVQEPEKKELFLKTIHFNPKIKYYSNGKSVSLKWIQPSEKQQQEKHSETSTNSRRGRQSGKKRGGNSSAKNRNAGGNSEESGGDLKEKFLEANNIQQPKSMDC